jgi:hypothetical protein
MKKILKSNFIVCVLIISMILLYSSFAGNVVVKEGNLTADGDVVAANLGDASTTTKGLAKFNPYDFDVIDGEVFLHNVYTLSNAVLHDNSTLRYGEESSPTKKKETKINAGIGENVTLRISFDFWAECCDSECTEGAAAGAQIYRNDSPVGTLRGVDDGLWYTFTEDIPGWTNGDLLQIYCYQDEPEYCIEYEVRNLKIKGTITGYGAVVFTSQDP